MAAWHCGSRSPVERGGGWVLLLAPWQEFGCRGLVRAEETLANLGLPPNRNDGQPGSLVWDTDGRKRSRKSLFSATNWPIGS